MKRTFKAQLTTESFCWKNSESEFNFHKFKSLSRCWNLIMYSRHKQKTDSKCFSKNFCGSDIFQ